MFNFFRKSAPPITNYSFLSVDMHSHLIPGIDDGAPDVETSVKLIREMVDMGFEKIITTPHIMADLYQNTPEMINEGLKKVRKALRKEKIKVHLSAAAEYLMDESFEAKLEEGKLLTLPGNHVLVEMSFFSAPPNLNDYLFRLQTKGYNPILAHPERYLFMGGGLGKYQALKERGCLLQVNILSLTGYYGRPVRENALLLLKHNLVDLLGTDLHHEQHARLIKAALGDSQFARVLEGKTFMNAELY